MRPVPRDVKKILDKYGKKIEGDPSIMDSPSEREVFTTEYETFRSESLQLSNTLYERLCNFSASILDISPPKEELGIIQESIEVTHLNITPAGAYSFATLFMVCAIVLGLFSGAISVLIYQSGLMSVLVTVLIFVLGGAIAVKPLGRYPVHLAEMHRLKASNQMVMCILYIVMYMRHTSNLEHAIKFAGEHVGAPLSLDLRKIVWDVETSRFSTMKESIDHYLEGWKNYNLDFVESFHLIESSLQESSPQRRVELLDKALDVMLEGTYENMLHYAQNIKSPITTLHMLGVILPVLGLIILPLMGSFLGVKWYQLAIIYNVFLPIGVYFLGFSIMSKRPVGYSEGNVIQDNPRFESLRKINFLGMEIEPLSFAIFVGLFFVLIGFTPVIMHALGYPDIVINFPKENFGTLMDYRTSLDSNGDEIVSGPFGIGAAMLSLVIVFGIAYAMSSYYKARSRKLISMREEAKRLEKEFQGALFQLGNRIGGGFPTEMVFGDVSQNMQGTPTGNFLQIVDTNIRMLGMSVTQAIFDEKVGAINQYPSSLIESSMKILAETSQKGPSVVSRALISISNYLDRINKVNERLKDLLSEIVGSMKAQISFLSPMISGIVVGIGTMITSIVGSLGPALQQATGVQGEGSAAGSFGALGQFTELFPIDKLIPPFYFQIVVGIYLIEVVFILTILANGIDSGVDKLKEEDLLAKNLYKSTMFYVLLAGITMIVFNFLAVMISSQASTGGGI